MESRQCQLDAGPLPSAKCVGCGGLVSSIDTACSYCGRDLQRQPTRERSSAAELLARLAEVNHTTETSTIERVQAGPRRVQLIETYPVPESKADVLDLLTVSVGNVGSLLPGEEQAWAKKARQLLALASVHAANDPDYSRMTQVLREQLAEAEARQRGQYRVVAFMALAFAAVGLLALGVWLLAR